MPASAPESSESPPAAATYPVGYGQDLLRRSILVVMTALLVARPLVLGEDPAFSSSFSDPGSLVLSLLTLCVAAAWAGWRFWTKQSRWYAGLVEIGLVVIVVAAFASINVALNKHAAWLTAWEWFVLLIGFTTLRQLAIDPAEQRGFFAALLATVVALSIYAAYQTSVELPVLAEQTRQEGFAPNLDSATRAAFRQRAEAGHAFGTFAHPNSFAGYLVLFIPALFGAAWLARRQNRPYWQRLVVLALAVIGLGALYLTHSRGAMLGLIAVVGLAGAILARRWLAANPIYLLVGLLAVVALGYGLIQASAVTRGLSKTTDTAAYRLDYWSATLKMVRDHPLLGVGAGNFSTYYPRYMAPTALEKVKDPHNLFLEQWVTTGLLGLAGLLIVLGAFAWSQRRLLVEPPEKLVESDAAPEPTAPPGQPSVRWEFYVGGAIGLLIGFTLHVVGLESPEIINEAIVAGGRSIIWFVAFALFEQLLWPARLRALVLSVGVAALLANLLVSGGIGYPSVVGMMLAAMALALNSPLPRPVALAEQYPAVASTAPLPIFAGLLMAYLVGVFYPTTYATTLVRDATLRNRELLKVRFPAQTVPGQPPAPYRYIEEHILRPLQEANALERWNPRIPIHIAQSLAQLWFLTPDDERLSRNAIAWTRVAQERDPASWDGYRAEADLRNLFAQRLAPSPRPGLYAGLAYAVFLELRDRSDPDFQKNRQRIQEQHRLAAQAYERLQKYDPTDAVLAYQIAREYSQANDVKACREAARIALDLDAQNWKRPHSLSDQQRSQLRSWSGKEAES